MSNQPVLRSRQTAPAPMAPSSATEALDLELRHALAVSKAGKAIPSSYRDNPGAVLVIAEWARLNGVPLLTSMQMVAFIEGRPSVDASMQRALAERAGYEVDVEVGADWAECTLTRNGRARSARYTVQDARAAGLLGKDNWKKNQEDMLVARATSRAIRRFAPSTVLGLYSADELDADPVDALRPIEVDVPEAPAVIEEAEIVEVVEAEPQRIVAAELASQAADSGWTVDTLKTALRNAGITQIDALRSTSMSTISNLAERPDLIDKVLFPEAGEPQTLEYAEAEAPF